MHDENNIKTSMIHGKKPKKIFASFGQVNLPLSASAAAAAVPRAESVARKSVSVAMSGERESTARARC